MLYSISWYVVLFQSIPEMFLLIILGFKLFNIDVDFKKALLVSLLISIIVYFVRKFASVYGLHTAILIFCSLILIKIILKMNIAYSFICIVTSLLINGLLQNTITPILLNFFHTTTQDLVKNPWLNIFFYIPNGLIMLYLYLFTIKKKIYLFDLKMYENNAKNLFKDKSILVLFIVLIQSIFIMLINQIFLLSQQTRIIGIEYTVINMIISIFTILVLFSIKGLGDDIKDKVEMSFLKTHLEQMEDLFKALRVQSHEHKRHIQTIQAMVYLDEIASAKEYIDGLSEGYSYTDDIIYVENMALTALINGKRKVAEINNIDFKFSINCSLGGLKMNSWDLCSILGNLLDNAFEAVRKEKNHRLVGLDIDCVEGNYIMNVWNNGVKISKDEMDKLFEPGYTTKESVGRGYGLFLIKNLLDKYKGNIEVYSTDKTLFKIILPKGEGNKND
ncbi:MAG TPA: GHKL domain-containing protein [Tissierellia bacterium]|nr:GHKL domain-containing protein [Tissierellia bacterium]